MELAHVLDECWSVCTACGHRDLKSHIDIVSYRHTVHSLTEDAIRFRYAYPVDKDRFIEDLRMLIASWDSESIKVI